MNTNPTYNTKYLTFPFRKIYLKENLRGLFLIAIN